MAAPGPAPVIPPPAAPLPVAQAVPVLQASSYLIIQYYTNIKGVTGDNNSKYRIFSPKDADPQVGNYITFNALPFINSVKLKKTWFSKLSHPDLIKTLFTPNLLSKYATQALADSVFKKGTPFNPKVPKGGLSSIVANNIKVYLDLLFSSGNPLYINNNRYEINNADWEKAPRASATNQVEESGNNSWLVSTKVEQGKAFKVYTATIYLDLEKGKTTLYSQVSSKCDAKYNKIREIAHNVPATKAVIKFLYGDDVKYSRKTKKKQGHAIRAPPLFGTTRPLRPTAPYNPYANQNYSNRAYNPRTPPPAYRRFGGSRKKRTRRRKNKRKKKTRRKKTKRNSV